jgi:hypothetical protein
MIDSSALPLRYACEGRLPRLVFAAAKKGVDTGLRRHDGGAPSVGQSLRPLVLGVLPDPLLLLSTSKRYAMRAGKKQRSGNGPDRRCQPWHAVEQQPSAFVAGKHMGHV